jgi:hypothetical protein
MVAEAGCGFQGPARAVCRELDRKVQNVLEGSTDKDPPQMCHRYFIKQSHTMSHTMVLKNTAIYHDNGHRRSNPVASIDDALSAKSIVDAIVNKTISGWTAAGAVVLLWNIGENRYADIAKLVNPRGARFYGWTGWYIYSYEAVPSNFALLDVVAAGQVPCDPKLVKRCKEVKAAQTYLEQERKGKK